MKEAVEKALEKIPVPGEKRNIIEAGFLKEVREENNELSILLEMPHTYEKYRQALIPTIQDSIKRDAQYTHTIKVEIDITKANKSTTPGGISRVKHVIAVASGKGGVGKSTVSVNLALSLARLGYSVGLLDADVFGPSIPKMLGAEKERPLMQKTETAEYILPIEKHGIKMLSIGFFVKDSDALAWRGPMAGNVLKQLIQDADWGELDVMVIDMPPGTSDIQLTLAQTIDISGAVMVSTPQDVALIDVKKGINFFQKDKIEVPILGIVENMAWFTPAELPNNKYYIFGKGGAKDLADELDIPFLGEIPLVQSIRENGDAGQPSALQEDKIVGNIFLEIARKIADKTLSK
ncbi:MAG: Mrp/NBP35 family ATP-binding protein [Bacteroidales bacterium]|jgi:ATP-binding protein involved in chromosome partitioning|nr:Mrp/NBP35 family ATP-binding protein [Bacteroidales bacterium]